MDDLRTLADDRGLSIVEDACEAIDARIGDRPVGRWGEGTSLAFYPNKQITTGEGGMVLTDDQERAALVRSLSNQGRDPGAGWFGHVRIGFNYRMSELQAALGTIQIERLDEILAKRRSRAETYHRLLKPIEGVRPLSTPPGMTRSWFLYPIRLDPGIDRDALSEGLARRGVQTGRYFPPIHLLPPYRDRFGYRPGAFPVTERVSRQLLCLPFHNLLREEDLEEIVGRVDEAIVAVRRGG
jgi:perosamine synthetase